MLIAFSATNPRKVEPVSESPLFRKCCLMFRAICPTTLQHFSKLFFGAKETFNDDDGGVYDNMDYLPKLLELRLDGARE